MELSPRSSSSTSSGASISFRQLSYLDSQLRSYDALKQYTALIKWPLMVKDDEPLLLNSSLLKLADFFKDGNNQLRSCILNCVRQLLGGGNSKTCSHKMVLASAEDIFRRLLVVLFCNDPVARALAFRFLGSLAGSLHENTHVHYIILTCLVKEKVRLRMEWDAIFDSAALYCPLSESLSERVFESILYILERKDEYDEYVQSRTVNLSTQLSLNMKKYADLLLNKHANQAWS